MRFRTFSSFPSFSGYLSGHSFLRTLAYGTASAMGRALDTPRKLRASIERFERRYQMRLNLIAAGILPDPLARKATPIVRQETPVAAIRASAPAPTVPPEPTWRPAPKPVQIAPKVKQAIPARSVCADPRQRQPAAVSRTGGLRGSTATRWRR